MFIAKAMRNLLFILVVCLPLRLTAQNVRPCHVDIPEHRCVPSMNYGGCTPGTVGSLIQCRGYGIKDMYLSFKASTQEVEMPFGGTNWYEKIIDIKCHYSRNDMYYYMETDQSKELSKLSVVNETLPGKLTTGGERFYVWLKAYHENIVLGDIMLEIVDGVPTETEYYIPEGSMSAAEREYMLKNASYRFELDSIQYTGTCADCNAIGDLLKRYRPDERIGQARATTKAQPASNATPTSANGTTVKTPAGHKTGNSKSAASKPNKGNNHSATTLGQTTTAPTQDMVYGYVEQPPQFDGDYNKYLVDNLQYPQTALDRKIGGRVIIGFVVSGTGELTDIKVEHSVDPELDNEALRVIRNMPRWKPGMQKGQPVSVSFKVPIVFDPGD